MTGLKSENILKSIEIALSQDALSLSSIPEDYNVENVSMKVLKSILSFTDYINKKVWFK